MKRCFPVLSLVVALVSVLFCKEVRAESPSVRLSLDTTVFSFNKASVEREYDLGTATNSFTSFGLGDTNATFLVPVRSPSFRFAVGYVPFVNLTIGSKLGVSGGQFEWDGEFELDNTDVEFNQDAVKYNIFAYEALPFVEYKFDIGRVQPFVMASVGYRGGVGYDDDDSDRKQIEHVFAFGGGAGAHIFLIEELSIDTTVEAMGGVGKSIDKNESGDDNKSDLRSFDLSAVVGMSCWF